MARASDEILADVKALVPRRVTNDAIRSAVLAACEAVLDNPTLHGDSWRAQIVLEAARRLRGS